jgi:hypothetical protein
VDTINDEMPKFPWIQFINVSVCTLHLAVCLRTFHIEVFNWKVHVPVPCTEVFSIIHCYSWNGTKLKSKLKIFSVYIVAANLSPKWASNNNHLAEFSSLSDNSVKVGII